MKKLCLSLVAAMMAAIATYAQDVYVATLNHEGTITEYYGEAAFQSAYKAAVDGDIITLSEGVFILTKNGTSTDNVTIKKSITIRGIGMSEDNVYGLKQTTIRGNATSNGNYNSIYLKSSNLIVEGINFINVSINDNSNSTFTKCKMSPLNSSGSVSIASSSNNTFTNCVINGFGQSSGNNTFRNCYIKGDYYCNNATMFNCFLYYPSQYSGISDDLFCNSNFTNCIIASNVTLPASNKVANCVGIATNTSNTTDVFAKIPEKLGCSMATRDIFNSWSDAISTTNVSPESFELSELGKQYRGVDNTEVGMLGGNYPYNPVVSIPRITKCEVAEKATADGKLSVNIEVTAPTNE